MPTKLITPGHINSFQKEELRLSTKRRLSETFVQVTLMLGKLNEKLPDVQITILFHMSDKEKERKG